MCGMGEAGRGDQSVLLYMVRNSIYGLRRYTSALRNNSLYDTYTMEFTIGGQILG